MHITLYACRARAGQAEAIRALYHQWEQLLGNKDACSTELLWNSQDPEDLIMLARFHDEDAAWAAAESADYRAWYVQLSRLAEAGPIVNQYHGS